ncbi:MAG TPA: hypothetical protein VG032_07585 [Acidimicrobiales bacterium]|jgi:hypothetical protein|nr:hypothetical protein [Acidimicrobiales bacterium]
MRRWLGPALAVVTLLLVAQPTPAGAADSQFVHIKFDDQARMVTMTLPTSPCRQSARFTRCNWVLFVDEPDMPGQPVVGTATGTSGVLSVPYPSVCDHVGRLQADALVGPPLRKMVGYRHGLLSTCHCAPSSPWPNAVTGAPTVHLHYPQGIYVGEVNNDWTLYATHPGSSGQVFSGTITTDGTFSGLSRLKLEHVDRASQTAPNAIQFRFVNGGYLDGINFASNDACHATFNLSINGSAAPPGQIFLGPTRAPATSSPMTLTR